MSHPRLSPDAILEYVLESLRELVDYDLAAVLGLPDVNRLELKKAAGPLADRLPSDYSISLAQRQDLARLIDRRAPYVFDDKLPHLDTYHDVLTLPGDHSCLIAPLYVADTPVGLLTLDHQACRMFTPEIVRFVATVSKLIAALVAQIAESSSLRLRHAELTRERNQLLAKASGALADLTGSSPAWTEVLDAVRLIAATELPVLISGETGTGKEMVARSIHALSPRASRPFVALNCSALSPSLAESELFGHEKGSFTGALSRRRGRFELADGGTLFLDEVADLPVSVQPQLLRVIQERIFERLGAESSMKVDVRILAATNTPLEEAMAAGTFREDLYYRLNVFPLHLPPLRTRADDVLELAERFLVELSPAGRQHSFSASGIEYLRHHTWPGNVRELRNSIHRAAILAGGGSITREHLEGTIFTPCRQGAATAGPSPRGNARGRRESDLSAGNANGCVDTDEIETLDFMIASHIRRALAAHHGRIYGPAGAAKALGLKPSTLQSKMKKLGIS
jgi:transcriptional regulator with GAF, ATPase, and Fis domain